MVLNMNKRKLLGILIPYYKNSQACEDAFKELMHQIDMQLNGDMLLYIYEDGQESEWLKEYNSFNVKIVSNKVNKGVSYARNQGLEYLLDKVEYILFLDSDDRLSDDYLDIMYKYCADRTHEFVESSFNINGVLAQYDSKLVRSSPAGTAIKVEVIGNTRFDEKLQIGEDTNFIHDICDLTLYRKRHAPTCYYYQLGRNYDSLTMKHQRGEIGKERV